MKKFKFKLSALLKQKTILSELAQKEFSEAQDLLRNEQEILNEMVRKKEDALAERRHLIETRETWSSEVSHINFFLTGQDLRIKNQNLRLKEFENLVEGKREILRLALSEVKILERLEEKQMRDHIAAANVEESKELDELAVLRFSRIENAVKGSHEDGI